MGINDSAMMMSLGAPSVGERGCFWVKRDWEVASRIGVLHESGHSEELRGFRPFGAMKEKPLENI